MGNYTIFGGCENPRRGGQVLGILTLINLFSLLWFVLHIVLTCIRQERANKWYRNTVKDLLLPCTVNQRVKNRIPQLIP